MSTTPSLITLFKTYLNSSYALFRETSHFRTSIMDGKSGSCINQAIVILHMVLHTT